MAPVPLGKGFDSRHACRLNWAQACSAILRAGRHQRTGVHKAHEQGYTHLGGLPRAVGSSGPNFDGSRDLVVDKITEQIGRRVFWTVFVGAKYVLAIQRPNWIPMANTSVLTTLSEQCSPSVLRSGSWPSYQPLLPSLSPLYPQRWTTNAYFPTKSCLSLSALCLLLQDSTSMYGSITPTQRFQRQKWLSAPTNCSTGTVNKAYLTDVCKTAVSRRRRMSFVGFRARKPVKED